MLEKKRRTLLKTITAVILSHLKQIAMSLISNIHSNTTILMVV